LHAGIVHFMVKHMTDANLHTGPHYDDPPPPPPQRTGAKDAHEGNGDTRSRHGPPERPSTSLPVSPDSVLGTIPRRQTTQPRTRRTYEGGPAAPRRGTASPSVGRYALRTPTCKQGFTMIYRGKTHGGHQLAHRNCPLHGETHDRRQLANRTSLRRNPSAAENRRKGRPRGQRDTCSRHGPPERPPTSLPVSPDSVLGTIPRRQTTQPTERRTY